MQSGTTTPTRPACPKDGGWLLGRHRERGLADLGFMYHWGPDSRGSGDAAKSVAYDNQIVVLSLPYIEWTNLHVSMEGSEKADNAAIMERIRWIADPARTESLDKLSYLYPYDARLGPDKDQWMREVFAAYLASLIYDRAGMLYGGADKSEFGLLVAKYIPFNADPDIAGGAGDLFLNKWWPAIEKYYADAECASTASAGTASTSADVSDLPPETPRRRRPLLFDPGPPAGDRQRHGV